MAPIPRLPIPRGLGVRTGLGTVTEFEDGGMPDNPTFNCFPPTDDILEVWFVGMQRVDK